MIGPSLYRPLPARGIPLFPEKEKAAARPAAASLTEQPYRSTAVKKVLLIEDDEDDQLFFREAIEELHIQIKLSTAANGMEAISNLTRSAQLPDLIIMDINMPCMNGMDCLKTLKANARFQSVPVVIFTTSQNPADKQKALAFGAAHFCIKPPGFALLKKHIAGILDLFT
ncbi:CheY-like chemotaxis protein [Filimonas zeae]|uniref:Response regulatory domain-containing protein n=1 Tax=Filimonas zeae TaxID=1737353 RepID=A0A917IN72_9BACT|nr:response regulator [Filimonas zeae]MDR6337064.1 CheY-like chemotaxis protein [Filimonas zeae]GGH56833.1 hypothetical protein GCM10011379_00850 [Filimonas zeae]